MEYWKTLEQEEQPLKKRSVILYDHIALCIYYIHTWQFIDRIEYVGLLSQLIDDIKNEF